MGTWLVAMAMFVQQGEAQEVHRLSGGVVSVYNLAGQVSIAPGSGSDVVVRVTRGGADAQRLTVESGVVDGRQTLRVVYPDDAIIYPAMGRGSRNTVRVRDDGTFGGSRGGGGSVDIRGSGRGLEAWADLVIEVPSGTSFAAHLAAGKMEARGVEGDVRLATGSGSVEVWDVVGSWNVDTGSGSASATNVRGDLSMDTGSGSITVRDVVGDAVWLDTGSGQIRGEGIRAGSLGADTGSGSISLAGVAAPEITLDTGSGSVELALLEDVELLDVDTGSGSVTIHAPGNLGAQVEMDTGSGGIDTDFAIEVRSLRRDRLVGVVGDGRGTLRIDTGSGSIRLLKN